MIIPGAGFAGTSRSSPASARLPSDVLTQNGGSVHARCPHATGEMRRRLMHDLTSL
jgi:hypothetical protein